MVDWDKRYRSGFYDKNAEPHRLLQEFWRTIPGKTVIDIAAGTGRDAIFLASKGFCVCGLEKSVEAIDIARKNAESAGHCVSIIKGDAETLPFKKHSADGVIVFYFLERCIMRDISYILKKGGILIYETFLKRQNDIDTRKRDPRYLLSDGELISFFVDFELLFYEETISASADKKRAIARFIGRKR